MWKNLLLIFLGYQYAKQKGWIAAKPVGEEFMMEGYSMDCEHREARRVGTRLPQTGERMIGRKS